MIRLAHRHGLFAAAMLGVVAGGAAPAVAQSDQAKAFVQAADEAAATGRYVDAFAAYAGAIAAAPEDASLHVWRADLLASLGHVELAARDYREAVRLKPGDAGLENALCRNLALANHDLDGALVACDAAVRLAPGDPVGLATRGYLYLRRGAYALAEKDFAAALEISPASPDEMYGHGLARIHLGRVRDGRDEIASATLDSAGLVGEWETRGFGMQGELKPGRPVTTAAQPVLQVKDRKVFLNRGEAYAPLAGDCGVVVAEGPQRGEGRLSWSGACRFGLAHGEGRLGAEGPVVRFVYGREIAGVEGAALAQKLALAYQPAEDALTP